MARRRRARRAAPGDPSLAVQEQRLPYESGDLDMRRRQWDADGGCTIPACLGNGGESFVILEPPRPFWSTFKTMTYPRGTRVWACRSESFPEGPRWGGLRVECGRVAFENIWVPT